MKRHITDDEFIAAWDRGKCSPQIVSQLIGISVRNVYGRRAALVSKGIVLKSVPSTRGGGGHGYGWESADRPYRARAHGSIRDGVLIVFSDAHYWPGVPPVAHEALLKVAKRLQPKIIIANGDVFDGATISRHDVLGWQKLPTVVEELDTAKTRLAEIERAAPKAQRFYTVGNHCSRFDRRLATEVGQFDGVPGLRLEDHLSGWPMSYSVLLNEDVDPVFVLHNIRGGMHAPFNNAKAAGCTVITGHLHSQKAQPVTTLLHDWEGIDAGCLADRDHAAFSYRMDRPADWRSGFVVMTFDKEGRHFPAEFCRVQFLKDRARAIFRGQIVHERVAAQKAA